MPSGSKKSPATLTDVQRLFGEDRLPDEVDVQRGGEAAPRELAEQAAMSAALDAHRAAPTMRETAEARLFAALPVEELAEMAKEQGVTPSWLVVEGDPREHFTPPDDPYAIDTWPAGKLVDWFAPLVRPPRDDLVGAYACLLVAALVGATREDGLVSNEDLFARLPRATVNDALGRLRYSGLLTILDDGRFRVAKTPLDLMKEKAA